MPDVGSKLKRFGDEPEEKYLWRIGQMVDSGEIDSWRSVNDIINRELNIEEDKWRDESSFRKRYQAAKKFYEAVFSDMSSDEYNKELQVQLRKLERAKIAFRDERNAWQRQNYTDTRVKETMDILLDRLSDIGKMEFLSHDGVDLNFSGNDLIVCLSDLHIGQTFKSNFGEYNTEIAQKRLIDYSDKIINIIKRHEIENVYVCLLGDNISGNIHLTVQVSNKENVIEQIKVCSELISCFCYQLSKHCKNVYVAGVSGNHSRIVPKKDDAIHDERLDNLILWIIDGLLSHVSNIEILYNNLDTGIARINVRDKEYVCVHGDMDSLSKSSISNLIMMLGFFPEAILCGHRHYPGSTEVGGVKVIQSGSLASTGDDYTIEKRLKGGANQTALVCDDRGIECIYNVSLE